MEIEEGGFLVGVGNGNLENDGTFKFPAGVKYIGKYCFLGCTDLRHLKIPEGVLGIGEYAFRSCINLVEIEIPRSVSIIRGNSFAIPDFKNLKNPLKKVIVTPDRKIDERFKSYFPPNVAFVVKDKENEKTNDGREK